MQQTEEIPEFSLEDLPEPPKLEPQLKEMDVPEPTENVHGKTTEKKQKKANDPKKTDSKEEKKEKKGFLSKIFGKKEKPKEEVPALKPEPNKKHESVKLQTLNDDQFAPPGLKMADEIGAKNTIPATKPAPAKALTKEKIDHELGPMPKMNDDHVKAGETKVTKHANAMPPKPPMMSDVKEKKPLEEPDGTKHADAMPPKMPAPPKTEEPAVPIKKEKSKHTLPEAQKSKGIFGMFGKKKKSEEAVKDSKVEKALEKTMEKPMPPPPMVEPKDLPKVKDVMEHPQPDTKDWFEEGVHFKEDEMEKEAMAFLEKEIKSAKQAKPKEPAQPKSVVFDEKEPTAVVASKKKKTPLKKVKGVGPAREKKLKKAGIKTAEHLAEHDHKAVAKKAKIPKSHAKKIVTHAKKITKLKKKVGKKKKSLKKGIGDIVKELEEERTVLETLQKKADINEDTIIEAQGHQDIIKLLNKLEKKRQDLLNHQERLSKKEKKLREHEETYKRDVDYIEKLKRRLDHDVRERTQYLINMEKEYFSKAQKIAKKKSELEIKEKSLEDREEYLKEQEEDIKTKLNDLEDRSITVETKEKKLGTIMSDLEKQDSVLRDKEDDLQKREAEYMKKLDALETHEKAILKELKTKREHLEKQKQELKLKEKELTHRERNLDKKGIAVQYAQKIMEEQKSQLIDDEFEQYVAEQLQGKHGHIAHAQLDENLLKNKPTVDNMHTLIESCSDLVKTNKVSDAKKLYNQIRQQFYDQSFASDKEREAVHQMIRKLYDEITIADMGI